MRKLKYGYVCEDEAQLKFLENILPKILIHLKFEAVFEFEKDRDYFTFIDTILKSKFADRSNLNDLDRNIVDSNFLPFAVQGLIDYQQDIFFIVRDVDDSKLIKLEKIYQEKLEQIINQKKNQSNQQFSEHKIIIVLPIHCIETWYMYEKWRRTKHHDQVLEDKFEMLGRGVKNKFYVDAKSKQRKELLDKYSNSLNVEFLKTHSESFCHFLYQLSNFLDNLLILEAKKI
jgi:hypothetical protein